MPRERLRETEIAGGEKEASWLVEGEKQGGGVVERANQ